MYNDFLLIRKMKQGDDNAFDLFVHKYYQEILSYCYHHCFDQTYAEDLTQETTIATVIVPVYAVTCLVFQPILYRVYKKVEIK